ncbi:DNA-binding transcriptional regulator, AcrR family [Gordonia malaquae]|uniref:Putative TetR family transcriptional regulator n=1 Tax=Gordonia malaquae NBRC 108250 TaxID=1223542 RepID=M3UW31_GORML|nr:TetR/AcrR family transcriptional regulator [Gordonia malaquae]GAC79812.1 putative TetR family transcriptional regulator [Gordonia malaquae NBRC 108250]SEC45253.1 DNA-binding transcriptional regulator, AcrR family [Gordonia malaquae]
MAYRPTEATRRAAQEKRAAMLAAARGLVADAGFSGATVAAIAEGADVSVGSVYSYFDNRETLLAEVFRTAAEYEFAQVAAAVEAAGGDPLAQLDALIVTFADRALRGRRMAWSLLFEPVIPAVDAERLRLRQWYRDLGEAVIAAGVASSAFVDQDVRVTASAVMGAISEALVGALNPDTSPLATDPDQLLGTIRAFCLRALGAPPKETP